MDMINTESTFKSNNGYTYALGRKKSMVKSSKEKGGFSVNVYSNNQWWTVDKNMSFEEAVKLLNKKIG